MGASNIDKERRKKRREKRSKQIFAGGTVIGFIFYIRFMSIYNTNPRGGIIYAYNSLLKAPLTFHVSGTNILFYFLAVTLIGVLLVMRKDEKELRKHDNPDTVNGEAHLMTLEELEDYQTKMCDPIGQPGIDGPNNMILSKDIRLAIDGFNTKRNCNVLVIGGSGAGKSRFFASPNILQFNTNFVITDPSGELREDYAKALENRGYEILTLDITDVYRSNRYNPFHYIREEKDVFILVNTLIKNTTPPDSHAGDPIWENGEKLILEALILYLWHTADESEQTFENVVKMINMAEVDENDATAKSPLDILFDKLAQQDPENLAVEQYKTFKIAAGKTMKSFLISVGTRLEKFKLSDICYLTSTDDFHFENFADSKKALFIIIPTADTTFNFIVSMLYSQLFTTLYNYVETRAKFGYVAKLGKRNIVRVEQAENKKDSKNAKKRISAFIADCKKGLVIKENTEKKYFEIRTKTNDELVAWRGTKEEAEKLAAMLPSMKMEKAARRCPYHVRFILDEFANIGQIPDFSEKLATIRKYEISCSIIIQALSQLKKIYKDDWNSITANCDTKLFLGCDDTETIKWLLEMLGKKTTTVENTSYQANGNGSTSYNKSSLDLLTIDQINMMQDDECIVRIRGKRPHYGKKYELTDHPNYNYAHELAGQFEIPISKEAQARRDRTRGPLRLRKSLSLDNAHEDAEGEENPDVFGNNPAPAEPAPVAASEDEKKRKTERNKQRKEEADKAQAEVDEYKDDRPPAEAPEIDEHAAERLLEAFGIEADATDEVIKEAVETMIELHSPSLETITYGITS